MGLDRHFADFLLCARDRGVDIRRVAALGRPDLFIDHMSYATRFSGSANRFSTERMRGTGVPENEAAENAT
jgi:hypothetical protein